METWIKISFNVKSIQWVKRFLAQKRKYLKGIQNKKAGCWTALWCIITNNKSLLKLNYFLEFIMLYGGE